MAATVNRSDKEHIQSTINETYRTVGMSQLAASIAKMLQQYIDTNQESSTLAGALALLDELKGQCEAARSDISNLINSGETGNLNLAESTVRSTLSDLRVRFGNSFNHEGAEKAMSDMAKWADTIKLDLQRDSKK